MTTWWVRVLNVAFFLHTIRSDWNNGNAHFLRGLVREMGNLGHTVTVYEPVANWSAENLRTEPRGEASLQQFQATYPDVNVRLYDQADPALEEELRRALHGVDVVIVHEWNERVLIDLVLGLRAESGFRALFHDTHHRASSSPESIRALRVDEFDGVLAFGDALTAIYKQRFGIERCWTLHEAADTTVFFPRDAPTENDLVWIGNWGEGERSAELREFLIGPAGRLAGNDFRATIYGVRYPDDGLRALSDAGIAYGGYLPNLAAPEVYAQSRMTMHVPRQQYNDALKGIPTIRVFEALASGIPLLSAPWEDTEELFRKDDFLWIRNGAEAETGMLRLSRDRDFAEAQAERGLDTVLTRHTCKHRALQLTRVLTEDLS